MARRGMVRSFQISAVFGHLTRLENVRDGVAARARPEFRFLAQRQDVAPVTMTARMNCCSMSGCRMRRT